MDSANSWDGLRNQARSRQIKWRIIACGSRNSAFDDFQTACRTHPDSFNILLVDSEGPVTDSSRWRHLRERDGWSSDSDEDQCHLMAQTMEAWLVADVKALQKFYGPGFQTSAIPANQDVEMVSKDQLETGLKNATRATQKGSYQKIRHGARLLGLLDPVIVRDKAPHCKRLFVTLANLITS